MHIRDAYVSMPSGATVSRVSLVAGIGDPGSRPIRLPIRSRQHDLILTTTNVCTNICVGWNAYGLIRRFISLRHARWGEERGWRRTTLQR